MQKAEKNGKQTGSAPVPSGSPMGKGSIWWVNLDEVRCDNSHVTRGIRPCVLVSDGKGSTVTVCPLSEKAQMKSTRVQIAGPKPAKILCDQILTIDRIHVGAFSGRLSDSELKELDRVLAAYLGLGTLSEGNGESGR